MPKLDQGVRLDRYMIIPRTLIFLRDGQRVLLLKGAETKRLWAKKYNGIGGHIEKGEDTLSAAKRELLEETGLESADLKLCGTILVDASDTIGVGIFVFTGSATGGILQFSDEGSLEWIDVGQLGEIDLVEDLKIILPRVLEMKVEDAPFNAHSMYDDQDRLVITLY